MQRFDLKRFRLDRKLTQKELAEILMCKQNYISNIENGIKPISKEKLDISPNHKCTRHDYSNGKDSS